MKRSSNRAALVSHINQTHTLNTMLDHEIMGEEEYERAVERLIRYREQSREAESERRRKRAAKAFRGYRNKFIKANMRLIMSIAMKFKVPEEQHEDLIAEAVIGFDKALDKYDGSTRISTYATWWVMQGIQRYILKRRHLIYHPVYIYEKGEVNFSNVVHIDLEDEEGKKIYDLPDQKRNPDEIIGDYERSKIIRALIEKLPERERDVINRRFGFTGGEVQTLDSIAERYGVTKERIRQIEKHALQRLEELMNKHSAGGLKLPKRKDPREVDWEKYPIRDCRKPEGRKYSCRLCNEKIVAGEQCYEQNWLNAVHVTCVHPDGKVPESSVKSTAVTKADEVKQPPAPKEESAPRDTELVEEEQLEEIKGPGLLDKFPDFDENWHMEIQKRWFDCFERLAEREGE